MKRRTRRGFIIPMVLMLMALLAMLGSALTSAGTNGLVSSRQSAQAERALALADTGLATGAQKLVAGSALTGETFPGEGSYVLDKVDNPSNGSQVVAGWGVTLPPKSTVLRSKGTTIEGTSRTSVAIFRSSVGAFQVGGLADQIDGTNSAFDSYDSTLETPGYVNTSLPPNPIYDVDPVSVVASSTILASNKITPGVINLNGSTVGGNVFAGPGGNAATAISLTATTVGLTGVLANAVQTPPIVVPTVPNGPTPVTPPTTANPATVYLTSPGGVKDVTITPPSSNGGPVTITHYCLTVTIKPDGKYVATEGGSGSKIEGDIQDQTMKTLSGTALHVNGYNPLDIQGKWHHIIYNYTAGSIQIDEQGIVVGAPLAPVHAGLPPWIFFSTPPPSPVAPATLLPGKYDTINIQGMSTSLVDGGVYVIKNLTVNANGQIYLGSNFTDTKIFVTGQLTIGDAAAGGQNAIVNTSRKPSALKIYYTGSAPVSVSGGASAFATLYAPNAWVTLTGWSSGFFGAISAKKLTVNDAAFHYDVATQGIGTGVDSSTFQLLARYHL